MVVLPHVAADSAAVPVRWFCDSVHDVAPVAVGIAHYVHGVAVSADGASYYC